MVKTVFFLEEVLIIAMCSFSKQNKTLRLLFESNLKPPA